MAVAIGTLLGVTLTIVVKGYSWDYVTARASLFGWNIFTGFVTTVSFVSLFFYVKYREIAGAPPRCTRRRRTRHLMSKQAIEAELKLMQAQVEPHFLFSLRSASVQYLTETDPQRGESAARSSQSTSPARGAAATARQFDDARQRKSVSPRRTLNILRTRHGSPRLGFTIDVRAGLATHPFPPEPR